MKFDVVVVGSGAAGMCAATALSQHGKKVALIEQSEQLAPLLRRFFRSGFSCDPGLHYVGGLASKGGLSAIFRYLGIDDSVRRIPIPPSAFDTLGTSEGNSIPLSADPAERIETLSSRFPDSREAITAYIERVQEIHATTPFTSFDMPAEEILNEHADESISAAEFLREHHADHELMRLLNHHGFYLTGMNIEECPLSSHAMVVGSFFNGVHTFPNGGDEVAKAYEQRLADLGVTVHLHSRVAQLEITPERNVAGAILDNGERIECDACVFTGHPHLLLDLLIDNAVRPAYRHRLASMPNTFSPMVVYLGMDDPPEMLSRGNFYHLGSTATPGPERESFVVMNTIEGDKSDHAKSVCVIRSCSAARFACKQGSEPDNRGSAYEEAKRIEIERTVDMFRRRFPARVGECKVIAAATPSTYESYTGTVGGSIYGIKRTVDCARIASPTPVKGLLLAGQSILAPGLLGATISGLIAAAQIVGIEDIWRELRKCQ